MGHPTLKAFNAGIINAEQFIDLNARIGGYDIDGNYSAGRTVADPDALRIAYAECPAVHHNPATSPARFSARASTVRSLVCREHILPSSSGKTYSPRAESIASAR